MDNQHKLIKGYRDLSQEDIDLMKKIKVLAEQVGELVKELEAKTQNDYYEDESPDDGEEAITAMTWVSHGKKDLQLGFMQLTRAIAKPSTF